jgi:hypothetical protein
MPTVAVEDAELEPAVRWCCGLLDAPGRMVRLGSLCGLATGAAPSAEVSSTDDGIGIAHSVDHCVGSARVSRKRARIGY